MVDGNSTSTPCLPPDPQFDSVDPLDGMSVINDTLTVKTMEEEGNLLMPSAVAAIPPERSPIAEGALPLPPELLPSPPENKTTATNNITPTQGGAVTSATIRIRPVIAPQDIIDFPSILRAISKKKSKQTLLNKKKKRMKSANQVDLTQYGMGVMGSTESDNQAGGDINTVYKEASKQVNTVYKEASKQEDAYLQHLQSMRVEQIQQQQAASKEEEVNQQEEAYMQHLRAMRAEGNDEPQTEAV